MTEDEAKAKWCPQARLLSHTYSQDGQGRSYEGGYSYNRSPDPDEDRAPYLPSGASCIGSACMAFRWLPDVVLALGAGRVAMLSPEDRDLENGGYWWSGRYAKNDMGYLHRHVAENVWGALPKGIFVDHADGDTLNCRRGNLRLVTPTQNAANAAARGGKSKHRGVFPARKGRWAAQISKAGTRLHLGTFDTEDEAAAAYDAAAKDIHGEFARLNLSPRRESGRDGYCGLAGAPQ